MLTKEKKLEVLDKVIAGFEANPQYSLGQINSKGPPTCQYRGPGGAKCAVGHLIPDEAYDPAMEGRSVSHTEAGYPLGKALMEVGLDLNEPQVSDFLFDIQRIHDKGATGRVPIVETLNTYRRMRQEVASC